MLKATTRDPLSGHPGHLDATQEAALTQFRANLLAAGLIPAQAPADGGPGYDRFDDQTLLRFLRARKFDLEKAQVMWADNEKWRKEFGTDEIARNFEYGEQAEVDKLYPQFYHKTDRDGRPIYIEQLGKIDVGKLYKITTQERMLQRLVSEYEKFLGERLPACTAASGHLVETSCTILDLTNVGIRSFYQVKDYVSAASNIGQNHYPETMGKFYIVNAPYLFSTVWSLVKPWLDEVTVAKISILGKNYKQELIKQIPEENLPTDLGGKCQCPQGCSMSDAGPWNKVQQS